MDRFDFYKEKWEPIKEKLQDMFRNGTQWIPGVKLASNILSELIDDRSADRNTVIKREFDKTIRMSNSGDADTVYICCQRMAELCQTLDYGPAGAWFGMFCEDILEDYYDAQYWYNKAASFGCGIGMYRVGLLYLYRKVGLPGTTNLRRCFTDAIAHGIEEAQDILDEYFEGETVYYPEIEEDTSDEDDDLDDDESDDEEEQGDSFDLFASILPELFKNAYREKFIPSDSNIPNIPEIVMAVDDVCSKLYGDAEEQTGEFGNFAYYAYCIWAAYAGMGAVMHWHTNWDALSKKGIYKTLVSPRGYDCMDEYVTDLIGIGFGTPQSDKLVEHLKRQANIAVADVDLLNYDQLFIAAKAMYMYGMVFEMHRLGLH